jgi:hypothetical protein
VKVQVCEECSIEFYREHKGRYCSYPCYQENRSKRKRLCPNCGGQFPYGTGGDTCSKACGYEWRRKKIHGDRQCETCSVPLPQRGRSTRRFCSRGCAATNRVGEKPQLPDGTLRPAGGGYVRIKINGKWLQQHRHVVEQRIGRPLEPHERVHHKNGDRADNRDENLELWRVKSKDPPGVRASDYHCPGCRCGES